METFISLIKYYPDNSREEFFGIGLIMFDEISLKSKIKFSEERIKRINKFYNIQSDVLINQTIKSYKNKSFNYKELHYLSNYENGTIRFSEPRKVIIDNFEEKFDFYYNLLVADLKEKYVIDKKGNISDSFKSRVRLKLSSRKEIQNHLNIAYTIKKEMLNNLLTSNMEIDFIGGNGTIVCGQIPNLLSNLENSENLLTKTLLLYNILDKLYKCSNKFNPKDCKIILNCEDAKRKENKTIIDTINEWQIRQGYDIIYADNENEIADKILNEIKGKEIIPFDKWIELNPAGGVK